MQEDRALINWTFRGYSTGQVTATPVWLSNSVLTWLAQLASDTLWAQLSPLSCERIGGGEGAKGRLIVKHLHLPSVRRLYPEGEKKQFGTSVITMYWPGKREDDCSVVWKMPLRNF